MEPERTERGQIVLDDTIDTYQQAAEAALALTEFFEDREDNALGRLCNDVQSVTQARSRDLSDRSRYGSRVTYVDTDGETHTAIVLEPEVASMHADEAWDPNRGEMVDPREAYPLGTVQLVYTPDYDLSEGFNFDRLSDLEVATSVSPATGPEETYCYYPGWDHALKN